MFETLWFKFFQFIAAVYNLGEMGYQRNVQYIFGLVGKKRGCNILLDTL